MADQIRINGNMHSWGSTILKIDGESYNGFTEISYGDKRERVKAYGMGRHQAPRGRSRGKYSVDPIKLKGPLGSMQALRDSLAAQASDGASFGDVEFEIVLQYVEPGDTPVVIEITRCVWVACTSSPTEGADVVMEEAEFDAMLIRRNGQTLFDGMQGSP